MVTLHCVQVLLQKNYSSATAALFCNDFLRRHPTRSRSRPSSPSSRSQGHRRADPVPSSPSSFTRVYMPGAVIVRGRSRGRGCVFERLAGVVTEDTTSSPWIFTALPLPLYLTNAIFFTLFFSVAYYLLHRWRDKIRTSTPLHVVTLSEIAAIVSLIASFIYLLGFFGIDFVQSIALASNDAWDLVDDDVSHHHIHTFLHRLARPLNW